MSGQYDQEARESGDGNPIDQSGSGESAPVQPAVEPTASRDATEADVVPDLETSDTVDGAAEIQVEDSIVVVAVTEEDRTEQMSEHDLLGLAEANRQELDQTLADLQQELAGMAKTGIPGVDAALDQLGSLDPNDLQESTQGLAEVLAKLEAVMSEAPKE